MATITLICINLGCPESAQSSRPIVHRKILHHDTFLKSDLFAYCRRCKEYSLVNVILNPNYTGLIITEDDPIEKRQLDLIEKFPIQPEFPIPIPFPFSANTMPIAAFKPFRVVEDEYKRKQYSRRPDECNPTLVLMSPDYWPSSPTIHERASYPIDISTTMVWSEEINDTGRKSFRNLVPVLISELSIYNNAERSQFIVHVNTPERYQTLIRYIKAKKLPIESSLCSAGEYYQLYLDTLIPFGIVLLQLLQEKEPNFVQIIPRICDYLKIDSSFLTRQYPLPKWCIRGNLTSKKEINLFNTENHYAEIKRIDIKRVMHHMPDSLKMANKIMIFLSLTETARREFLVEQLKSRGILYSGFESDQPNFGSFSFSEMSEIEPILNLICARESSFREIVIWVREELGLLPRYPICAICSKQILRQQRILSCGHAFHSKCIFERFQQNPACPECGISL